MATGSDSQLSHIDADGNAHMVDVGDKAITDRRATAEGFIRMKAETRQLILDGGVKKGDVVAVARIAAIQAAKQCSHWIPLCHPLPLDNVDVEIEDGVGPEAAWFRLQVSTRVRARTGVEMEALTAVSGGLLTIYDMCKAVDRGMEIYDIRLLAKSGGRSGNWTR